MNKEYICVDDKVIVKDEYGYNTVQAYRDSIEEILVTENVIESLENKISSLNMEKEECEKRIKKPFWLRALSNICPFMLGVFIPLIMVPVAKTVFNVAPNIILVLERISILTTLFASIPATAATVGGFIDDKLLYKRKRALDTQSEMIDKRITEEKNKLKSLRQEEVTTSTKSIQTQKINDETAIKNSSKYCDLFYDCGYNIEYYYNYYQEHGKLPDNLVKLYDDSNIELTKEYLEEKGPVLVKKRNTSIKK